MKAFCTRSAGRLLGDSIHEGDHHVDDHDVDDDHDDDDKKHISF